MTGADKCNVRAASQYEMCNEEYNMIRKDVP